MNTYKYLRSRSKEEDGSEDDEYEVEEIRDKKVKIICVVAWF